jgi:transcriptional regulator with XRE-family HTH domain
MSTDIKKIPEHQLKRFNGIAQMLREMRFAEGLSQSELIEHGISRRQVQRAEHRKNLTLLKLFEIIDAYGYRLDEFFHDME